MDLWTLFLYSRIDGVLGVLVRFNSNWEAGWMVYFGIIFFGHGLV